MCACACLKLYYLLFTGNDLHIISRGLTLGGRGEYQEHHPSECRCPIDHLASSLPPATCVAYIALPLPAHRSVDRKHGETNRASTCSPLQEQQSLAVNTFLPEIHTTNPYQEPYEGTLLTSVIIWKLMGSNRIPSA